MIPVAGRHIPKVYQLTEGAVTIEFGITISEMTISRVNIFDARLKAEPIAGMFQTVTAYASLTVYFDPLLLIQSKLAGLTCFEKARGHLLDLFEKCDFDATTVESRLVNVPVCYGGAFGPDIEYLAGLHQISTEEVIRLHSAANYKVYMIGFIPGFSYMGGLSPLLETPRKQAPVRVSAGAVGIAGSQTGVYSLDTPGGWQIIGRTPLVMFAADRAEPSLLKAGDNVHLEPISASEFEKLSRG